MTQTAERTISYEVYERELERRKQAERTTESQMRTINALQNEVHWLEAAIFNPAFNEVDIRLVAKNTPREIRMGLTDEAPERKIYLPACGDEVYTSDKTAGRHLRKLKDMGAFSYRTERDQETGNTRAILGPLPAVSMPAELLGAAASRGGGSTWEDGKRTKRCQTCLSPLEHRTQERCTNPHCPDCGKILDGEWKSPKLSDIDPDSQSDTDPLGDETHECPSPTVDTVGVDVVDDTGGTPDSQSDREPSPAQKELQALDQWVVWRYGIKRNKNGKLPKLPYDAKIAEPFDPCDYTDPESWASHDLVVAKYEKSQSWARPYDGIGICFKKGGGLVGIDRDGNLEPLIHSFGERSVSGGGIHQFAHGKLERNIKNSEQGIEMYDHDRFFTWTGDHIEETPLEILDCQAELDVLFARIAPPELEPVVQTLHNSHCPITEEEVLHKARNAKNGEKFWRLWNGIIPEYASQSEADLALCKMLAYWTDNTVSTINNLFQQSHLMRDKWNEKHGWYTYGELTIKKAIGQQQRRAS
jgi:hypothetical protein